MRSAKKNAFFSQNKESTQLVELHTKPYFLEEGRNKNTTILFSSKCFVVQIIEFPLIILTKIHDFDETIRGGYDFDETFFRQKY